MSIDNVTDSEVENALRAEWEATRGVWEASDTYARLTREAEAAVQLSDARRAVYKATQTARQAAREVGCQEYRPSLDHCLRELQHFIDRVHGLSAERS